MIATPQLLTTSFTCVEMLCRTRPNTADAFVIQRDANKLKGILQVSQSLAISKFMVWCVIDNYTEAFKKTSHVVQHFYHMLYVN